MMKTDDEGMPGFLKALEIIQKISLIELTDEEITEALKLQRMSDLSYGVLWGDLSPMGRQRDHTQLEILNCLGEVLKFMKEIEKHPGYFMSVKAAIIKTPLQTTKMLEDAEKWNVLKGWFHEVCPFCGKDLTAEDLKNGWCHHCVEDDPGTFHPIKGKHLDEYVKRVYGDVKPLDPRFIESHIY